MNIGKLRELAEECNTRYCRVHFKFLRTVGFSGIRKKKEVLKDHEIVTLYMSDNSNCIRLEELLGMLKTLDDDYQIMLKCPSYIGASGIKRFEVIDCGVTGSEETRDIIIVSH